MCTRIGTLLALLLVALMLVANAPVAAAPAPEAMSALAYLRAQQNADGGYPGFSGPASDPSSSADAALAFISSGISPGDVKKGDTSLLDYLHASAPGLKTGPAAKFLLVAANIGEDPTSFGGANLLTLSAAEKSADGIYGGSYFTHALVILAHAIAESPDAAKQLDNGVLLRAQQVDGGWGFDAKGASDTNTTAVVVQALVASGQGGDATTRGMAYMEGTLQASNLYPFDAKSGDGDANSTAYVLQAKIAARANPNEIARTRAALVALQNPSGAFPFQKAAPDDNLLATVQAIPAINGRAFPTLRED
jgi:prenyltransferase/squalene oxidase-like repeat protein